MKDCLTTKEDLKKTEGCLRADMEARIRSDMQKIEGNLRADLYALNIGLREKIHLLALGQENLKSLINSMEQRLTIRLGVLLAGYMTFLTAVLALIQNFDKLF